MTIAITVVPSNDAPILVTNSLAIAQGGTVTLGASELSANDVDGPAASVVYQVSGVQGGQFERVTAPGVPISSFTQAEVDGGEIRFVHDGTTTPAAYQVAVSDGVSTTAPAAASVSFTPAASRPSSWSDVIGDELSAENDGAAAETSGNGAGPASSSSAEEAAASAAPAEDVAPQPERDLPHAFRSFALIRLPRASIDLADASQSGVGVVHENDRDASWEHGGLSLASQQSLWLELDRLHRDLEDEGRGKDGDGTLHAAVELLGIAFSGALVAMALRSSALWAAALSSLPLWRRMDPLMVLGISEEERRKLEDQQREARSEEGSRVGRVLDGGKTLRHSGTS
jgi:hypothetical protein